MECLRYSLSFQQQQPVFPCCSIIYNTYRFTELLIMSSFDTKSSEGSKETEAPLHIDVRDLTFNYPGREPILRNLNMQLTNGARCLLIG
jgi:ABC-type bacteriocin/lantibiotic exporter with double-glycine peptidase domain